MASPYKTLQIWVKLFSEYLARNKVHRAENWQECLHVSPLFSLRFSTFIFDGVTMKNPQLKSCGDSGKGWVLLTSLSLSPIGIHIFLRSKNDVFRYHTGG